MINFKNGLLFITLFSIFPLVAQEELSIRNVVNQLAEGIERKDTALMGELFLSDARLVSIIKKKGASPQVMLYSKDEFINDFAKAKKLYIEEKMQAIQVFIDGDFATVTTDYSFFINRKRTHCGENFFHLYKVAGQWKIASITDTRRTSGCPAKAPGERKVLVNQFLEDWHFAAAEADEDAFFGSMTNDGIYIGTDETEYWFRDELRSWAKSAFEKDVAWDFKTISRNIYFSDDGKTAWWDEKLDTWMGVCRGSGVLSMTSDGWKIRHYHLALAIPNDKMNKVRKILPKKD